MIEILLLTLIITAPIFWFLKSSKQIFALSIIAQLVFIGLTAVIVNQYLNNNLFGFIDLIKINSLGVLMLLVISFVTNIALFYSFSYLQKELSDKEINFQKVRLFYFLTYLFIASLILVVSSGNLGLSWLGIELSTLTSTFLVGFYNKKTSIEAAWKYFITNTIGVTIALVGIFLMIYAATKSISIENALSFSELLKSAKQLDPTLVKMSFVFLLIGFGTKVGLVPMHTWLPDAHSKAVTPISAVLSSVLLPTALFLILKVKYIADAALGNSNFTSGLMIFLGVVSIVYATFLIIIQKNYKRMLAYSSIENMGIMTILFALNTPLSILFACYHYVFHALAKSGLFLASGNIYLGYHSTSINKVKGLIKQMPITGFLFLVFILAIIGMPPFGIFSTEIGLFTQLGGFVSGSTSLNLFGFGNNQVTATVIMILIMLGLAVISIGFINALIKLSLTVDEDSVQNENIKDNKIRNFFILIVLVVLLLVSVDSLPFVRDLIINFVNNPIS